MMPKRLYATAALLFVTLALLAGALPAGAQSPVTITSMNIALWPEYDKPGVLVIYTGRLPDDVKLPAQLTFAIPLSSGGPSSTATIDPQGQYRYRKYTVATQGDQILVSYDTPNPAFQFEYYYDPFAGQGAERKLDYTYRADYAIGLLTLEVQQPAAAADLQMTPAATSSKKGSDGLTLYTLSLGQLAAGQTTALSLTYRNADQKLSSEILGLPTPSNVPFENATQNTPSRLPTSTVIIIVAAVVAVAVVIGLYVWSNARRQVVVVAQPSATRKAGKKGRAGANRPTAGPAGAPKVGGSTSYCHQCGRGLKPDEQFCPACGTRRKDS